MLSDFFYVIMNSKCANTPHWPCNKAKKRTSWMELRCHLRVTLCNFLPHTAATADGLFLWRKQRVRVCVCVSRCCVTESYMHISKKYYPVKTKLQGSRKHSAISILKRHSKFPCCLNYRKLLTKDDAVWRAVSPHCSHSAGYVSELKFEGKLPCFSNEHIREHGAQHTQYAEPNSEQSYVIRSWRVKHVWQLKVIPNTCYNKQ
jgi:hypothetical protein